MGEIEVSVGVGGRGREGRPPAPPQEEGVPLREVGASLFTIGVGGPDYDVSVVQPWLAWRDEANARCPCPVDDGCRPRGRERAASVVGDEGGGPQLGLGAPGRA